MVVMARDALRVFLVGSSLMRRTAAASRPDLPAPLSPAGETGKCLGAGELKKLGRRGKTTSHTWPLVVRDKTHPNLRRGPS